MKNLYPNDWESIINNCRVQQYFGAVTGMAADAVVAASGYGAREEVLSLERDEMILNVAGDLPVIARKPNYRFDPPFGGLFDVNPFYRDCRTEVPDVRTRPVFRKTVAPSRLGEHELKRRRMALANKIFLPTRSEIWKEVAGDERRRYLLNIGVVNPEVHEDPRFKVRAYPSSFYSTAADCCEVKDTRVYPPLSGYCIVAARECYWLDGNSEVLHRLNAELGLTLNVDNIITYLSFFSANLRGDDGRYFVVDSTQAMDWSEVPEDSFLEDLDAQMRSPRITRPGVNDEIDPWWITAEVLYGKYLFTAQFKVSAVTGCVEMDDEEKIASELPVISDLWRLHHIATSDAEGAFQCVYPS